MTGPMATDLIARRIAGAGAERSRYFSSASVGGVGRRSSRHVFVPSRTGAVLRFRDASGSAVNRYDYKPWSATVDGISHQSRAEK